MHVAILAFTIFAAWLWGDWRNWQKYHTTMLYAAAANLLYNFIYHDHLLWQMKPVLLFGSHNIGEVLYTFAIFPLSVLILLTDYPKRARLQILRIIKFIAIYMVLEWIAQIYGFIIYKNGWNMWWSLAWNCMMFPMWVLHHKKPLAAYAVSIFIIAAMLILFPVYLKG